MLRRNLQINARRVFDISRQSERTCQSFLYQHGNQRSKSFRFASALFSTKKPLDVDAGKTRSIEDIYQRKSPLEHVLLRPGMYIGSTDASKDLMWVVKHPAKSADALVTGKMQRQQLDYIPALYKIFDEILVNAVDNKTRDKSMKRLEVTIDPGSKENGYKPWISVFNDGKGIPIKLHKEEKVYIPELVLGHLLTGSNFDDSTGRLTGGRHGYGAKLTNIFSNEFVVETGDLKSGLKYKQTWRNNMRERFEPDISEFTGSSQHDIFNDHFTRISFSPDLDKFDTDTKKGLTKGMVSVLEKRVYDVAGCLPDVSVKLNDKPVPINGFKSYISSFNDAIQPNSEDPVLPVYSRINKRWEVGVLPSDIGFTQISFVNGMSTSRGGTHVPYVSDQLSRRIADHINSNKRKYFSSNGNDILITPAQVKPHLAIFVNCFIENPAFDSQMKEYMSSKPGSYGSTCILSDRFSKEVIQSSGIVQRVVDWAETKQRSVLMKKVSSKLKKSSVNVPKLEDANLAGGVRSDECTLILTEGDSAKALAVAGLAVIGRDKYGVFPLKGKFLNVRDASDSQLANNAEFMHLCTILGIQLDQSYDSVEKVKTLRYGKVMIMADQDHDGSHIKGLVLNIFHAFWPELLKSGYVSEFITPIVKATKGKRTKSSKTANEMAFYNLPDYKGWKNSLAEDELKKYTIKYYKGLGTNTSEEGRSYFRNLPKHNIHFQWLNEKDGDSIGMVFDKKRVSDRKVWLNGYVESATNKELCPIDDSEADKYITLSDFVNNDLIQFSNADNLRSLPCVVDGMKPSQRKVLYACFKRQLNKEIKVAQLAGYCSEHTAYHHGEASLHSTITNMAQDFVGSNNIPLLYPSGQFGTRLQGGKDAASPRYIFTRLNEITNMIFPPIEEAIYKYQDDDGLLVEPEFFIPIVPMLLINGAEGIGTGWSTSIPCYHPVEVVNNLLNLLSDKEVEPMTPWYKGFAGDISFDGKAFVTHGKINIINSSTLNISELPVGKWVEDYKVFLLKLVSQKVIRSFSEHHTERSVNFEVKLPRNSNIKDKSVESLRKQFRLENRINTGNMHAFDADGKIKNYKNSEEILEEFYQIRLDFYKERKSYLEFKLAKDLVRVENKVRFMKEVMDGSNIDLMKKKMSKKEIIEKLREMEFDTIGALKKEYVNPLKEDLETSFDATTVLRDDDFDYLLNIPLLTFTTDHISASELDLEKKRSNLMAIQQTSYKELWYTELTELKKLLLKDKEYSL